jgi:hypothetical protein
LETLSSLFVGKPFNILAISVVFLTGYLVPQFLVPGIRRRSRPLLTASCAWGLYAAWEWLVLTMTPEANIRVDLLIIWPILAIVSAWALYRAAR